MVRAKWVAVVRLGGAEPRFAVQCGKQVRYVDGFVSLIDLMNLLAPGGLRGGDET